MYRKIIQVESLKQYSGNIIFEDFLVIFKRILEDNHDRMDETTDHDDFMRHQGANRLLKKLLKDLT